MQNALNKYDEIGSIFNTGGSEPAATNKRYFLHGFEIQVHTTEKGPMIISVAAKPGTLKLKERGNTGKGKTIEVDPGIVHSDFLTEGYAQHIAECIVGDAVELLIKDQTLEVKKAKKSA